MACELQEGWKDYSFLSLIYHPVSLSRWLGSEFPFWVKAAYFPM